MSITDHDIAVLCNAIYAQPDGPQVKWDYRDDGKGQDGVCWAVKLVEDHAVVVFRGSKTVQDWALDFEAFPKRAFHHDELGPVHAGFYSGLDTVVRELVALYPDAGLRMPLIVAGHSLGAARATLLCGLMILIGRTPVARVVFGEPRSGFAQLQDILRPILRQVSYCNGHGSHDHDIVTNVPFRVPPLWNYIHAVDLTIVDAPPPKDIADLFGILSRHHMGLYVQALAQLEGKAS